MKKAEKEVISSRQNKVIKLVCSLERKKGREESGLFRFDGIKLCCEALSKGIVPEYIIINEAKYDSLIPRINGVCGECNTVVVAEELFSKMSDESSPEGVITVAKNLDKLHKIVKINSSKNELPLPNGSEKLLILESIRDPGNLGTIIRTAASLGVDRLVLSSDCADIYNPKTIRGAMGALFMQRIDILGEGELARYITELRKSGRRIYAAALRDDAKRLGSFELSVSDCFVIGNEGHGLSSEVIEACDGTVIIPMKDGCESLNAAMAAGILMWETLKS